MSGPRRRRALRAALIIAAIVGGLLVLAYVGFIMTLGDNIVLNVRIGNASGRTVDVFDVGVEGTEYLIGEWRSGEGLQTAERCGLVRLVARFRDGDVASRFESTDECGETDWIIEPVST